MKRRFILSTLAVAAVIVLPGCQTSTSVTFADPDDPYVGWYKLPSHQDTIIPVFKIEGAYYSVCRGAEIPFKRTAEGLEWALEPSSMVGTKIAPAGPAPVIIIRDQQAEAITSETSDPGFQYGQPQRLRRVKRPSWFLDPTASPPRSNDDFIGCFEPVWFPYYRLNIQKDAETYRATYLLWNETGQWSQQDETVELAGLSDSLGFTDVFGRDTRLIYNKALCRFEISPKGTTPAIAIPLRRISGPPDDSDASFPELVPIGIPSWN